MYMYMCMYMYMDITCSMKIEPKLGKSSFSLVLFFFREPVICVYTCILHATIFTGTCTCTFMFVCVSSQYSFSLRIVVVVHCGCCT